MSLFLVEGIKPSNPTQNAAPEIAGVDKHWLNEQREQLNFFLTNQPHPQAIFMLPLPPTDQPTQPWSGAPVLSLTRQQILATMLAVTQQTRAAMSPPKRKGGSRQRHSTADWFWLIYSYLATKGYVDSAALATQLGCTPRLVWRYKAQLLDAVLLRAVAPQG